MNDTILRRSIIVAGRVRISRALLGEAAIHEVESERCECDSTSFLQGLVNDELVEAHNETFA